LAEFRDHFEDFRALGIRIAAVAVDSPSRSDRVRSQYELPFPILCDTEGQVLRAWGLFNSNEKDGIAVPAIVLVGRDRRIRLSMIEGVATRVCAADLLTSLRSYSAPADSGNVMPSNAPRQRVILPSLADFGCALWNLVTRL
jgi:peroxiredoxin